MLNNSFYPFYESLTSVQQTLYKQFLPALEVAQKEIKVTVRSRAEDGFAAIHAITYDHPELFWVTGAATSSILNGYLDSITPGYNDLANNLSYRKQQFDQATKDYLRGVPERNVLEQEKYIHDKLVKNLSYVHGVHDQTAYGALVEGQAVCAGYTRAFQHLMQQLCIPCFYCAGSGRGKGGSATAWGPHAWNIIKLGSDYYNVDITWNDCFANSSGNIDYKYYNCTDAQIAADHKRDSEHAFLPKCTSTKYSFENITGVSPELERVYQSGVTSRTPIADHRSFVQLVAGELRKNTRSQMVISFPLKRSLSDNAMAWFQEAVESVYGRSIGWNLQSGTLDYKTEWIRIEFTFTIQK